MQSFRETNKRSPRYLKTDGRTNGRTNGQGRLLWTRSGKPLVKIISYLSFSCFDNKNWYEDSAKTWKIRLFWAVKLKNFHKLINRLVVRESEGVILTSQAEKFRPILGGKYMSELYEMNCWTLNFLAHVNFIDRAKYWPEIWPKLLEILKTW